MPNPRELEIKSGLRFGFTESERVESGLPLRGREWSPLRGELWKKFAEGEFHRLVCDYFWMWFAVDC